MLTTDVTSFSFLDITGLSEGLDPPDPFSQTRVGNKTNLFVEKSNLPVSIQDDSDDMQEFSERSLYCTCSCA